MIHHTDKLCGSEGEIAAKGNPGGRWEWVGEGEYGSMAGHDGDYVRVLGGYWRERVSHCNLTHITKQIKCGLRMRYAERPR